MMLALRQTTSDAHSRNKACMSPSAMGMCKTHRQRAETCAWPQQAETAEPNSIGSSLPCGAVSNVAPRLCGAQMLQSKQTEKAHLRKIGLRGLLQLSIRLGEACSKAVHLQLTLHVTTVGTNTKAHPLYAGQEFFAFVTDKTAYAQCLTSLLLAASLAFSCLSSSSSFWTCSPSSALCFAFGGFGKQHAKLDLQVCT